jgi:hypothetical protein
VTQQHLVGRGRAPAHGHLPVASDGGKLDLARDEINDAIQDVVLVRGMLVQGHRLDPELFAEPAHRERLEAAFVGKSDRGLQHSFPAQRGAPFRPRLGFLRHRQSPL